MMMMSSCFAKLASLVATVSWQVLVATSRSPQVTTHSGQALPFESMLSKEGSGHQHIDNAPHMKGTAPVDRYNARLGLCLVSCALCSIVVNVIYKK